MSLLSKSNHILNSIGDSFLYKSHYDIFVALSNILWYKITINNINILIDDVCLEISTVSGSIIVGPISLTDLSLFYDLNVTLGNSVAKL